GLQALPTLIIYSPINMIKRNSNRLWLPGLLLIVFHFTLQAQDTISISLPAAEQIFFNRNLAILAEKYNIGIAEAQVIQARLHINPNFQFTGNIYNPEQKKFFDLSN